MNKKKVTNFTERNIEKEKPVTDDIRNHKLILKTMMNRSNNAMKALGIGVGIMVLLVMAIPTISTAQNNWMYFNDSEIEAEFNDRFMLDEVEFAMTTKTGSVDMGIEGDMMMIQFSDLFFEDLEADITEGDEEYDFVQSLKVAISSGVKDLLDRGLYIPISEIAEADYENGKIILIDHHGEEIFGELEVDDVIVVEDFRGRDARRFIRLINNKMSR
ncbi:MAG TPA: hypothetical protein VKM37_06445 [Balneolaceae bacterium]|nr:hypothetical protein [Balneolaceae bacterium]